MTITTNVGTRRARKILIAGGGIAGTVAALALKKAGLEPVIAEAYDVTADGVGAFLTLAPNGVRGLRALGVDGGVLDAGFATPRFIIANGDGRVLGDMSAGASAEATTTTIRRAELYAGLRRQAEARGIDVRYGKRLVDARRDGDAVVARFADGSELEGDLLIGADGVHSRVRALVDPRAPSLRYLGLLNTGGFSRPIDVPDAPGAMTFIFGKRGFFGWTKHPSGEVWWFANPVEKREPSRAELAAMAANDWRARLIELFSVDASPACRIIEATERIIAPWPTHDLPRVPTWHRERMVVIGDAAHAASPSSGQGASMAIEDGLVLALCLRDLGDVDAALTAYERLRRRRVERVVAQGRRNGSGKIAGPVGRALRDWLLPLFFRLMRDRDPMAWIHQHRIDWDARV